MKKLALLLILTLMCLGCNNTKYFVRSEYGYGTPFAMGQAIVDAHNGINKEDGLKDQGLAMDGHQISIKAGVRGSVAENVDLSIAAGPSIYLPTKGVQPKEEFVSFEVTPRMYYTKWFIHPYGEVLLGVGWTDHHKWEGQSTRWNFSLGGGIGVEYPIDDHWTIDLGYRTYHISNGSNVFGSPKPNHGYNTDMIIMGLQYDF